MFQQPDPGLLSFCKEVLIGDHRGVGRQMPNIKVTQAVGAVDQAA